jgi:ureidoglycolate lyase
MKPIRLKIEKLTSAAFEPFGEVIEKKPESLLNINYGMTSKFPDLFTVDTDHEDGRPAIHLYECEPVSLPLTIEIMERHPLGSQAFIPLHDRPFLVVVAPVGDPPEPSQVRGFISNGHQGINYHKGVWHHYQISLGLRSDYLVLDREGPGGNFDEHRLSTPLEIDNEN